MSGRPTHRLKSDGSLVYPAGYPADAVELLPIDHYAAIDLEVTEQNLIAAIDREREARRIAVMTRGEGQSYIYAQKAQEVADYSSGVGSAFTTLTPAQWAARFPFAMAEVDATGDPLADVIARFGTGIAASRSHIAAVEAVAMNAKRAIRAAPSIAAKKAVFATIDWT